MEIEHGALVYFSKFYGLIYLLLLSTGVLVYTFWPKNKKRFDYAAKSILTEEDHPHA
ncbi:MAG: cbb3-type cytochrome c oxidase subunit 3 [Alphaproteobacteria bacterium]|nr:cbb3-type cytochrome c oxidase subunit 3 [Alphaproteobacteria bacterium]